MPILAVLVSAHHLTGFRHDGDRWRLMPLAGDAVTRLDQGPGRHVDAICDELHDPTSIATAHLHVLVDDAAAARAHATGLLANALEAGIGRVDVWRLAPLTTRVRAQAPGSPEQAQWCIDHLLPGLDDASDGAALERVDTTALQAELDAVRHDKQELAERVTTLEGQLSQLRIAHREECAELNARMAALATPPVETLVRFMPLFFRQFWEKFSPVDMAYVLRVPEVPVVPSPFPEPNGAALATMRRQFRALPEPVRRAVLTLARDLGVNWEVRSDMLDLLEEA
jgi:hypothetical protein